MLSPEETMKEFNEFRKALISNVARISKNTTAYPLFRNHEDFPEQAKIMKKKIKKNKTKPWFLPPLPKFDPPFDGLYRCCIAQASPNGYERCTRPIGKRSLTGTLQCMSTSKGLPIAIAREAEHNLLCRFHWRVIKYSPQGRSLKTKTYAHFDVENICYEETILEKNLRIHKHEAAIKRKHLRSEHFAHVLYEAGGEEEFIPGESIYVPPCDFTTFDPTAEASTAPRVCSKQLKKKSALNIKKGFIDPLIVQPERYQLVGTKYRCRRTEGIPPGMHRLISEVATIKDDDYSESCFLDTDEHMELCDSNVVVIKEETSTKLEECEVKKESVDEYSTNTNIETIQDGSSFCTNQNNFTLRAYDGSSMLDSSVQTICTNPAHTKKTVQVHLLSGKTKAAEILDVDFDLTDNEHIVVEKLEPIYASKKHFKKKRRPEKRSKKGHNDLSNTYDECSDSDDNFDYDFVVNRKEIEELRDKHLLSHNHDYFLSRRARNELFDGYKDIIPDGGYKSVLSSLPLSTLRRYCRFFGIPVPEDATRSEVMPEIEGHFPTSSTSIRDSVIAFLYSMQAAQDAAYYEYTEYYG